MCLPRRDPREGGQRARSCVVEEAVHALRARLCLRGVERLEVELDDRVVVDAGVLVPRRQQRVEDGALRVPRTRTTEVAIPGVCPAAGRARDRKHVVRPRRAGEGRKPAVEDGKLGCKRGAHGQRSIREALHHRVGRAMRERVHGPLVLDKAVHARHTADDIELGLVGRVAVPRLLPRHVRSAAGHANGSGSRVGRVDGVALVALEPVHLEPPLVAKEVVKGTVLLVEHDDVLDARVSRREEQEGVHRRTTRRARRGPRVLLGTTQMRRLLPTRLMCLTAVGVAPVGCPTPPFGSFEKIRLMPLYP